MIANEAVTILLRRVRDPQGSQHSRTFVLRLLTDVQRILNALYADVVESAPIDVQPRVMHLPLSATLPSAIRLVGIRSGGRDLTQLDDWRQLALLSRQWFRTLSTQHQVWAPVGRDAFVVWPGVDEVRTLEGVYVKLTNELDLLPDSALEIDNGYWPVLFDLCEACLLIRGRQFDPLLAVQARLKTSIAAKSKPKATA
jgi:hypothetical protein